MRSNLLFSLFLDLLNIYWLWREVHFVCWDNCIPPIQRISCCRSWSCFYTQTTYMKIAKFLQGSYSTVANWYERNWTIWKMKGTIMLLLHTEIKKNQSLWNNIWAQYEQCVHAYYFLTDVGCRLASWPQVLYIYIYNTCWFSFQSAFWYLSPIYRSTD